MKIRFLLSGLAAMLLISLPARAQKPVRANPSGGPNVSPPTVTLEGHVRSAQGDTPLEHIRVELHRFGGAIMSSTFTGATGEFSFYGITGGDYMLVVEQDGFEPLQQPLQVSDSINASNVVLFLHRLEGPRAIAPSGTVSARQLALPPSVQKDFDQGKAELFDKHKPEASLPLFARVIVKVPDFYEAYHYTGVACEKLGRGSDAEKAFRKSIELSKGHFPESQISLASLLVDLKRFTEAEDLVRQVLTAVPENWAANYELARAQMAQHREGEAEKSVQETLKAKPDVPEAYLLLANIHMNRGDDASLIKDLDNFLRLDPSGPKSEKARQMREQTLKDMAEPKAGGKLPAPPQ